MSKIENEKVKELFSDEAFVKELFALDTAAEVQAALKEKGVELTEADIMGIRELLVRIESGEITKKQVEDGELPEELLEQISGGSASLIFLGGLTVTYIVGSALVVTVDVATDGKW